MDRCFAKLGMAYPSQRKHDCKRAHVGKTNEGFFHFIFLYGPDSFDKTVSIGNSIPLNQGCHDVLDHTGGLDGNKLGVACLSAGAALPALGAPARMSGGSSCQQAFIHSDWEGRLGKQRFL